MAGHEGSHVLSRKEAKERGNTFSIQRTGSHDKTMVKGLGGRTMTCSSTDN
jgi:hypothetical protein